MIKLKNVDTHRTKEISSCSQANIHHLADENNISLKTEYKTTTSREVSTFSQAGNLAGNCQLATMLLSSETREYALFERVEPIFSTSLFGPF